MILLSEIKRLFQEGKKITFEIANHPRIPNTVKANGAVIGLASITTIKNFKKWQRGVNL